MVDLASTTYDADALYSIDSTASYPNVMYTWMGTSGEFIGDYYNYYSETPIFGVNPTSVARVEVKDSGSNTLIYAAQNAKEFTVGAEKTIVLYELKNKYGERYYYEVEFHAVDSNLTYSVTDGKGVIISNGKVTYNEKDNSLRKAIFATYTEILSDETYREQLERTLYYTIGNTTERFELSQFSIYTDASYEEDILPYTDITTNSEYIWRAVKDSKYALLIMTYKHEGDIVHIYYLYHVNFNGSGRYEWMSHPNYFSNITYTYPIYTLYGSDGTNICNRISVVYSQGVSTVLSSYQQSVTFHAKGTYTATLSFYITDFEIFGGAKRDGITLNLKQTFEVLDRYDDVYITYVTDSEHPFDDGTTERTVIYSLANDITTLSKKVFDTNSDILYGWVIKPNISASTAYGSGTVMEAAKYIGNFNSQHITLYAVWDSGMTITAQADGNDGATQFIYMGTSGKYQVKLSDFDNMITTPSGYKHVGWTGGFLGDEIVARESYSISDQDIEWDNPDYFVITAVFKKILTVGYSIDGTYSNDWQRGETVVEGGTVANPNLHANVSCKIDGYEFKGWYVKGDETKTIVDLSTYEIKENTTFVALFGTIEEEST